MATTATEIIDIMKAAGLESPDISVAVRRIPGGSPRDGEKESRYRSAQETDQRRDPVPVKTERHPVEGTGSQREYLGELAMEMTALRYLFLSSSSAEPSRPRASRDGCSIETCGCPARDR